MAKAQQILTTKDLAARLSLSEDTALRILAREAGVLRINRGARTIYCVTNAWFAAYGRSHQPRSSKEGA